MTFWFFIVSLGLLGVGIAIYAYRLKFGGALSSDAADWSAFGAYSGGIFGPLISFLTLLAVLKTVYLQRELLDNQAAEFIKIDEHQKQASEKQEQQLNLARSELQATKTQAYLSTQLQIIEHLRQQYQREADGLADAIKVFIHQANYSSESQSLSQPMLDKKKGGGECNI